jgi:hypothetical protein
VLAALAVFPPPGRNETALARPILANAPPLARLANMVKLANMVETASAVAGQTLGFPDDPGTVVVSQSIPSVQETRQERFPVCHNGRSGVECAGFCAALGVNRGFPLGIRGRFKSCPRHLFFR